MKTTKLISAAVFAAMLATPAMAATATWRDRDGILHTEEGSSSDFGASAPPAQMAAPKNNANNATAYAIISCYIGDLKVPPFCNKITNAVFATVEQCKRAKAPLDTNVLYNVDCYAHDVQTYRRVE